MTNALLVGIDGSECCRRAVDFAVGRAKATGEKLVVAYVIEWSPYSFNTPEENEMRHKRREEEIERARSSVLDPLVAELSGAGIEVEGIVRHGHAAEVLSGLADEVGATQVFVGRRGGGRLSNLLFGSVASSLAQISPVPVTVVP